MRQTFSLDVYFDNDFRWRYRGYVSIKKVGIVVFVFLFVACWSWRRMKKKNPMRFLPSKVSVSGKLWIPFFFEKIKIYFLRICCTSRHGFEDSCNDLEKGLDERIVYPCTYDRGKVFRRKFINSIYLESEILLIHYHWINFNH